MSKIICGKCEEILLTLPQVKCIFVDIPDNINFKYKNSEGKLEYNDNLNETKYLDWISNLIWWSINRCDIFWLSYNQIHDLPIKHKLYKLLNFYPGTAWNFKQINWVYTFGQYNDKDFSRNFRPIVRLMKNDCITYPNEIKVTSKRMEIGDKRAKGLRVPGDVWDFPRIVGNAKERRKYFPTQHPEALMNRIIKYSCGPNDIFVDLCSGSFTSAIVCQKLNIDFIAIEQSEYYCKKGSEVLGIPYVFSN